MDNARKIVQMDDVKPRTSKKKKQNLILGIIALLVLIGLGVFFAGRLGGTDTITVTDYTSATVSQGPFEKTTEASGTVVIPATVSISNTQEGYLEKVYVAEGDKVQVGSLLVSLSVPDLLETRDDLINQLALARLSLKEAEFDIAYSQKTQKTSIERLRVQKTEAEKNVALQKDLVSLKSSRQSDLDAAEDSLESINQKLDDALAQFERDVYKNEISLEKQRASLATQENNLRRTEADISSAQIRSTLAGEVLSLSASLDIRGGLIKNNTSLATIADRSETYLDFEVNEEYAKVLGIGGTMNVSVGANSLSAKIVRIGKVASTSSDGLTSTISVRAKPVEQIDLTPGASAVAILSLGVQENVLTLPRGTYLTSGGQKFVYKIEGTTAVKTEVKFGTLQGNTVEVLSGLAKGDKIITSSYQTFINYPSVQLNTK